jgi:indolepyruvate ferredoxin oxidoreductase beta subunit
MGATRLSAANIVIAGVGGQGSILAAHLLAESALRQGHDVRLAQTFGAATRGGSVMAHVRIGEAWSPTIMEDQADAVVSMEPLEGLRVAVPYLKPGGWALLNTRPWIPLDAAIGRATYPQLESIVDGLSRLEAHVLTLDATELALQAGNERAANTVLLGGLFAIGLLDLSEENLFSAMRDRWPERLIEVNQAAYGLGRRAALEDLERQQWPR